MRNKTRHLLTDLQRGGIGPASLGAADLFGSQPGPMPWPRGPDKRVVIPYCYKTPVDRETIKARFDGGVKIWENALGGKASKTSGHAVVFEETMDGVNSLYCEDVQAGNGYKWNERIPYDTIAIEVHQSPIADASATVGYVHDEEDPEPWNMFLKVGVWVDEAGLAHELGHLMGMAHEHQRPDRDEYIKYNCSNIRDLDRKLSQAQKHNPSLTIEKFCTDWYTAVTYAFVGSEYIAGSTGGAWGRAWSVHEDASRPYDHDSIMQYWTVQGNNRIGCATNQLSKCALVRYKSGKKRPWEQMAIPRNTAPSREDVKWVRETYPWKD